MVGGDFINRMSFPALAFLTIYANKINISDMLHKIKGDIGYIIIDIDGEVPDTTIKEIKEVGGIKMQIQNGINGYLVNSVEGTAYRIRQLLHNPQMAAKMGIGNIEYRKAAV